MVRIEAVCACVLILGAHGALGAHAQDVEQDGPAPVDSTQSVSAGADSDIRERSGLGDQPQAAAVAGHGSGFYAGVVPGAAKPAKPPKAPSPQAPLTITWPGFQMRPDGSSRVFIQSNKPVDAKVLKAADGKFELELAGARVAAKTNRLPLDTRYFNTPVTKVSVHAARSGTIVALNLRASVTPQITSEQGPAGYYFTYIELPKGEYVAMAAGSNANAPILPMAQPSSPLVGAGSSAAVSVSPRASGDASASASLPTLQAPRRPSKVIGKATGAYISGSGRSSTASSGTGSSATVSGSPSGDSEGSTTEP